MPEPDGFSWIERPRLAAMARPRDVEELAWLRQQRLDLVLSLTEEPLPRRQVNEAGLLAVHVPIPDMEAPGREQVRRALDTIRGANQRGLGVAVHCAAGLGRTGVILACWFVDQGLTAANAIAKVRRLRPGSIETDEQEQAIHEYEKARREENRPG